MNFHWSNENIKKDGAKGSGFWSGRAWWNTDNQKHSLNCEWLMGRKSRFTMLEFERGEGREICFKIGIHWLFTLFIAIETMWFPYRSNSREIGVSIHDGSLWLYVWRDPHSWSKTDPWWMNTYSFYPAEFFLGRRKHSKKTINQYRVKIDLPERSYPANVHIYESVWKRPRSPRVIRRITADIEMETPIPIPGKGENSWDLDDDAIFELAINYQPDTDIIEYVRNYVFDIRERYAHVHWMPEQSLN